MSTPFDGSMVATIWRVRGVRGESEWKGESERKASSGNQKRGTFSPLKTIG